MKTKVFLFCAVCSFCVTSAYAQSVVSINVQGEKTVNIGGNSFVVALDDANRTASLVDKEYKIDDSKFPLNKRRKFENIDKRNRGVEIPSKVLYGNVEYTVTTIGRAAFAGYQNIDYVVVPNTVTAVEDYAFFYTSLVNAELPASVKVMGQRVFGQCRKLKSITLPNPSMSTTGLFSESPDVEVRVAELDTPSRTKRNVVPQEQTPVYASVSDVDVNVPVSSVSSEETFAVIIANENYEKEAKVHCALNDGRIFKKYCTEVLGVPNTNIRCIEDATLGNMMEVFTWVAKVAKVYAGDAKIIVYYAGHGIPNERDGAAYLLPVDVAGNNVDGAYSLNSLYATLGALNAKSVTLFMDACFSGSQRGDGMLMAARGVAIKSKAEHPQGKMVVFSAAQGDETAYPYAEKGHGLFTYFLLKKLKETKGDVDYGTLSDYIQKEVSRRSVVVNNKPQTPTVSFSPQVGMKWRSMTLK